MEDGEGEKIGMRSWSEALMTLIFCGVQMSSKGSLLQVIRAWLPDLEH